jgi:hypothetical protein
MMKSFLGLALFVWFAGSATASDPDPKFFNPAQEKRIASIEDRLSVLETALVPKPAAKPMPQVTVTANTMGYQELWDRVRSGESLTVSVGVAAPGAVPVGDIPKHGSGVYRCYLTNDGPVIVPIPPVAAPPVAAPPDATPPDDIAIHDFNVSIFRFCAH